MRNCVRQLRALIITVVPEDQQWTALAHLAEPFKEEEYLGTRPMEIFQQHHERTDGRRSRPEQYLLNHCQRAILGVLCVDVWGLNNCPFQELRKPRDERQEDSALKLVEGLFQAQRRQHISQYQ